MNDETTPLQPDGKADEGPGTGAPPQPASALRSSHEPLALGQSASADRSMLYSRSEFHAAIRSAFSHAADDGCREIFMCDANFADWPISEVRVVEDLTRWAYAHRKLTLFALDYGEFARKHSRWVEWRKRWAHIVECRALNELEASQVPSLLLAPGLVTVRLFDPVHYRGSVSSQESDAVSARELLDAVAQRSVEAFPATTLGL